MSTVTQFQQLTKPDLADAADITVLDANLDKLDKIGTVICTNATRPTTNLFAGLEIYETDTKCKYTYDGATWKSNAKGYQNKAANAGAAANAYTAYTTLLTASINAVAGRWYEAYYQMYSGLQSVSTDLFLFKLVQGATDVSDSIFFYRATSTIQVNGMQTRGVFQASATGALNVTAQVQRGSGTGTLQIVTSQELIVNDLGA